MRKRLTSFGNSLGFILERPILDLLRIDRETEFEVSTDGNRLILEPIRRARRVTAERPEGRPEAEAPDFTDPATTHALLAELERNHGLTLDLFRRLHHFGARATLEAHKKYAPGRYQAGQTNEATAKRLHACLTRLHAGGDWNEAIDEARRLHPVR